MHKDFLGRELAIGDFVVFILPNYRRLKLANIADFTKTKVRVRWGDRRWENMLQNSSALVKVEGVDLTMFLLQQDHSKG